MSNIVSSCCHASILQGVRTEYPLGGRTWGINLKIDVCEECRQETEPIEEGTAWQNHYV